MSDNPFTTLKIIVLGSMSVGKTSILNQLVKKEFIQSPATIGADCFSKTLQYNGKTIRLALWDTAGMEQHHALTRSFFRDVQGVVFVYDVTNYRSFLDLQKWKSVLDNQSEQPVITILGNKIDMENREVPRQEGMNIAKMYRALYLETSAKTSEGVETAFEDLITKIMETPGLWKRDEKYDVVDLQQNSSSNDPWYQSCVQCWFR